MSTMFDQSRAEAVEAISKSIAALRNAPDLDALRDQKRAVKDDLLKSWSELMGDDEHSDWLDKIDAAARDREREF